jgi:rod shape-determining protein MreD
VQRYVLLIGLLLLAATIQGNLPSWLIFKGARPDLILVVIIVTALTLDPVTGTVIGFVAGFVHGSIVGESVGSFIVSRTIIGFAAGCVTIRLFSENPVVPVVAAGGLTFAGEGLFLLLNPIPDFTTALNIMLAKALYNSLLALIAYWILRRIQLRNKIKMATARL